MWVCSSCHEECDDDFDVCWSCRTGRDGSAPITYTATELPQPPPGYSVLISEPLITVQDMLDTPPTVAVDSDEGCAHVAYDASVVQSYADHLYSRASMIEVVYTLMGLLAVGAVGAGLGSVGDAAIVAGIVGALVGAGIGYLTGSMKASAIRLGAQMALCQVQIEANTRNR